jgi:dienelactone hydrolase
LQTSTLLVTVSILRQKWTNAGMLRDVMAGAEYIPVADVERFRVAAAKLEPPAEVYLYDADHGFMAHNRENRYDDTGLQLPLFASETRCA